MELACNSLSFYSILEKGLEQRYNYFGGGAGSRKNVDDMTKQEREQLKKNLFVGVDYIGEEEIRVKANVQKKTKWQKFKEKASKALEYITLLNRDVAYIEARYDKTITTFFLFFRFMVNFSLITALGFLYLVIAHSSTYDGSFKEWCDGFYPCAAFYSRFSSDHKIAYALTLFLFVVVGYMLCIN